MTSEQREEAAQTLKNIDSYDEMYRTYNPIDQLQIDPKSSGTVTLKSSKSDVDEERNKKETTIDTNNQDESTNSNKKSFEFEGIESEEEKICITMSSKPTTFIDMEAIHRKQLAESICQQ